MLVSKCITMSCFFHTTLLSYSQHTRWLAKDHGPLQNPGDKLLKHYSRFPFVISSQRNGSFRVKVEFRKGMTHIQHIIPVQNPLQLGNLASTDVICTLLCVPPSNKTGILRRLALTLHT